MSAVELANAVAKEAEAAGYKAERDAAFAILRDLRDKAMFFHTAIELEDHGQDMLDGHSIKRRIVEVIGDG